jgi:hypothetical protein
LCQELQDPCVVQLEQFALVTRALVLFLRAAAAVGYFDDRNDTRGFMARGEDTDGQELVCCSSTQQDEEEEAADALVVGCR